MGRISYDGVQPGQLHETIISHVNDAISHLPVDPQAIVAMTVAGNPTMRDLFFGLDVQTIGQRPYVSRTQIEMTAGSRSSTAIWSDAASLHLTLSPQAVVYGLPLISNHVGADIAAALCTIPVGQKNDPFMLVDIDTNTKVVIGDAVRLICASCPAGPAFEGGVLSCGMPASAGAITALQRRNGGWRVSSIGSVPVRGVCGSGFVDILAELRSSNEMDELGRFRGNLREVPINEASGLSFTRSDASELAQAKAANGVGQWATLRRFGIDVSQLGTYYLAGAFGSKMNLANARAIGLILPVPDERIVRLGNASVEGAKVVLLSRACRDRIERLVRAFTHVELEQEEDFFELFVEMAQFKELGLV